MGKRFLSYFLGLALAATLVAGCTGQPERGTVVVEPTIAPVFSNIPQAKPTPRALVLPTVRPNTAQQSAPDEPRTLDVRIYGDQPAPGWSLEPSSGVTYTTSTPAIRYEGVSAIAARPTKGFGQLILGLQPGAPNMFKREDVLGVRFMVSGGSNILPSDGLIVTVYGSKRYSYFVAGDRSATQPEGRITSDDPLFPETRLYFLGLNRDVQPGEWAEVTMWLDEHFTPDYTYVTGLIIKNDEAYRDSFYVDDVTLILAKP